MTLEEKVAHLANFTILMDYFYKLGAPGPNKWFANEFARLSDEVEQELKDKANEAGNRNNNTERPEAGADLFSRQPGSRGYDWDRVDRRAAPAGDGSGVRGPEAGK